MKNNDNYLHFKGTAYIFKGIALPLETIYSIETKKLLNYEGKVRHHENVLDIDLYRLDNALFIDSDIPYVIYESTKDNKIWCREVDNFFGYKFKEDGDFIVFRKFKLIK